MNPSGRGSSDSKGPRPGRKAFSLGLGLFPGLFDDYRVRRFQAFETVARRQLKMLDHARLDDVAALPGNRLEALRGDS